MADSVLIVDDNELHLRLAETVLAQAGFEIGLARTAAEARAKLRERGWSAVLMDVRLPDGNGLDVVRELRDDPGTAKLPVAALTASAIIGDPRSAYEAGCDVYIAKPIEIQRFAAQVRHLIETRQGRRPGVHEQGAAPDDIDGFDDELSADDGRIP